VWGGMDEVEALLLIGARLLLPRLQLLEGTRAEPVLVLMCCCFILRKPKHGYKNEVLALSSPPVPNRSHVQCTNRFEKCFLSTPAELVDATLLSRLWAPTGQNVDRNELLKCMAVAKYGSCRHSSSSSSNIIELPVVAAAAAAAKQTTKKYL
jgi:hypothetical protein